MTNKFFIESSSTSPNNSDVEVALEESGFLTGVIETQRLPSFEKMIWRVSHGYALLKYSDIDHQVVNIF